jgi:hypothetical protein
MAARRIGCIGWGSLLWDPRTLPMAAPFALEGPELPIEFSRVSLDGRVTLVIDRAAPVVPTYSVPMAVEGLEEAVEALAIREKVTSTRRGEWIGYQERGEEVGGGATPEPVRATIAEWLERTAFDAVVWTALPSRRPDGELGLPTLDQLLEHLQALRGESLARAEEYIRRAPPAVRTPYRAHFEAELGWSSWHR